MPTWNYIVVILCLLLLAFISWNEWQRLNKSRLGLRLIASLLAVASFACLALPLTRTITATKLSGNQVVLLTDGFNKDSVDNFLRTHTNTPVYATDKNLMADYKPYKAQFFNIDDMSSIKKQAAAIHVFGYGLDNDQLESLPSSIVFHPTKITTGISSINWQHKIKAGDAMRVQGNFLNTYSSEIKLIFSGYGVNLDTAIISANKNERFDLSAIPKQLGKAVYTITAISGKDTLEKEPVPFEIGPASTVKILILAASPDFENKFLKNWLSQNSYPLVTRTTISKNKYEKTFLNTSQTSFNNITSSFLKDFDLVIADVTELAAISKPELAAIESQVSQKGLGLIVKGDSAAAKSSFYSRPFPVLLNADSNRKDISLFIPVSNQYASPLALDHLAHIRPQAGTKSLIEDRESNVIVSSTIYGTGKLIYTTLNSTFSWMLSGDNKTYQTFWSYLLGEATAKTGIDKSWSITPAFPYANKEVEINYTGNSSETPQVQIGKDFVHLIQNPDLPFQWQGSYWPQQSGWQPIIQDNNNTFWWYAYNAGDWKTMEASHKISATLQKIAANTEEVAKDVDRNELITVPVNKKYFFVMFLICVGFLWLEKKL